MLKEKRSPQVLSKTIDELSANVSLKIPADLAYLEGHFKEMPVVPGVVQLHWVVTFVKDFFGVEASINKGTQIKFMNLMRANDTPMLSLSIDPEKNLITYKYHYEDAVYSSGKLSYDT